MVFAWRNHCPNIVANVQEFKAEDTGNIHKLKNSMWLPVLSSRQPGRQPHQHLTHGGLGWE